MKRNKLRRALGIILSTAMSMSLLPGAVSTAGAAAETPPASDNAVNVYADKGDGFELLTSLYFEKGVTEKSINVSEPIQALRIVKGDCYSLHLDKLTLNGTCPEGYERKLSATDNDLIEITDSRDFELSGSGELVISARTPIELMGESYSLKFPTDNRGAIQTGSYFYSYTLGSKPGKLSDISTAEKEALFVSEMCYPDSGHPDAPIDFYVKDDGDTLYVFFEAFCDNTCDNGKDFAGVHIKSGDEVKTYKVYSTEENEYGRWWFDYTDSSDVYEWEHMCYLVEIPMSEIETSNGVIDLAFEYYGTVSAYETLTRLGVGDKFFVTEDELSYFTEADLLPASGVTVNADGGSTETGEWWLTNTGTEEKPAYTLTLNGAAITNTSTYYDDYCIFPYGSLTIKLVEGTVNTVGVQNSDDKIYGIYAGFSQDLIIEGAGTLNVYGTKNSMCGTSNLTVRDGADVNAECNTKFVIENYPGGGTSYTYSYTSVSFNNITVDGAKLTAEMNISDVSKDDITVHGIEYWNSMTVKNNSEVKASASGGSSDAYGGNYALRTYSQDAPALDGSTVKLLEGDGEDSAEEVETLTNTSAYEGSFYSKPYVRLITTGETEADEVEFTVINIPKGGEKTATIGNGIDLSFDSDKYLVVPDQYAESVEDSENLKWFEGTFQKGKTYYGSALIVPLDDSFGGDLNFTITGGTFIKYKPTYIADDEPTGDYKVYFSVPVTKKADVIGTVAFTDVTLPEDGDTYYDVTLSDGDDYKVNDVHWEDEDGEIPDLFEDDNDYYLVVTMTPEKGSIFADSIKASLNGGKVQTVTAEEVLGKTEIRIKVSLKDITITFNANGGTVDTESDTTDADGKLAKLPTPTRSGYSFDGWFTAASGGKKVTTATVFDENTEIFAQWTRNSGGSRGGGNYTITSANNSIVSNTTPTAVPDDNKNVFEDVDKADYFYDAVNWAVKAGVTSGTTDTTFSPNEPCTRAQTVTFLWRTSGSPEPAAKTCPFTDINEGDYFYKAVLWAYENGITVGTTDTTFSPDDTVTRAQTVTFLYRMAGAKVEAENPFTDVSADAYYYDSVIWAYEKGITSGTTDVTFSPDDECLRAQIVTFLYRCIAYNK